MFTAKKLLDAMGSFDGSDYKRLREKGESETYDEIVARLKKLKDDSEGKDDKEDNNEK
jgi:hypothetical protein